MDITSVCILGFLNYLECSDRHTAGCRPCCTTRKRSHTPTNSATNSLKVGGKGEKRGRSRRKDELYFEKGEERTKERILPSSGDHSQNSGRLFCVMYSEHFLPISCGFFIISCDDGQWVRCEKLGRSHYVDALLSVCVHRG